MKFSTRRGCRMVPVWLLASMVFTLAAGQHEGTTDTASYVVAKNVMVPMRDGVRLATDVYFPARDGVQTRGQIPGHSTANSVQ